MLIIPVSKVVIGDMLPYYGTVIGIERVVAATQQLPLIRISFTTPRTPLTTGIVEFHNCAKVHIHEKKELAVTNVKKRKRGQDETVATVLAKHVNVGDEIKFQGKVIDVQRLVDVDYDGQNQIRITYVTVDETHQHQVMKSLDYQPNVQLYLATSYDDVVVTYLRKGDIVKYYGEVMNTPECKMTDNGWELNIVFRRESGCADPFTFKACFPEVMMKVREKKEDKPSGEKDPIFSKSDRRNTQYEPRLIRCLQEGDRVEGYGEVTSVNFLTDYPIGAEIVFRKNKKEYMEEFEDRDNTVMVKSFWKEVRANKSGKTKTRVVYHAPSRRYYKELNDEELSQLEQSLSVASDDKVQRLSNGYSTKIVL